VYSLKKFHGGSATVCLLCFKDKIVVQWYHYLLCHPSINRTEETIGQHFHWPIMREQITNDVLTCAICQTQKKQSKKYRLLPKKKQRQCHGTDYALISLVHIMLTAM
jgi:hypothetical protein